MADSVNSVSNVNNTALSADFLRKQTENILDAELSLEDNFFANAIDEYWENPDIDNEAKKNPEAFTLFLIDKLNLADNKEYQLAIQKAVDYIATSDDCPELSKEDFIIPDEKYYLEYKNNNSEENGIEPDNKPLGDVLNFAGSYLDWAINMLAYRQMRPLSTLMVFIDNQNRLLNDSKYTRLDKYYHARANAQAGQNFDIFTPISISVWREVWDMLRKNTWDKGPDTTFSGVLNDSVNDFIADMYGLGQGLLHPLSDVDDILNIDWLRKLNS